MEASPSFEAGPKKLRHSPHYIRLVRERFLSRMQHREEQARSFGMKTNDFNRMLAVLGASLVIGGASASAESSGSNESFPNVASAPETP